VEYVIIQKRLP